MLKYRQITRVRDWLLQNGHRGWVYYLAVDVAQRGRGLGRQMMEACEDWVRSRGIPKI